MNPNPSPSPNRNLNHDVSWPLAARKCHLGSGPKGRRAHSAHCARREIAECAQRLAPSNAISASDLEGYTHASCTCSCRHPNCGVVSARAPTVRAKNCGRHLPLLSREACPVFWAWDGELDKTKALPPGLLIHAGWHGKNQMKKTLSGLHNGKNKGRNQVENKPFRSAQGEEQGD